MPRTISWSVDVTQVVPEDVSDDPQDLMDWASINANVVATAVSGIGAASCEGWTIYNADGDVVVEHY